METVIGNVKVLDSFFDENTMSIHIKENRHILKKKGGPGNWTPKMSDNVFSTEEVHSLIDSIMEEVKNRDDGFLEIDKNLSKIVQVGSYRIVIVYPPLSDGIELTIVKPIKKLDISDYNLDNKIIDLFKNVSKGILISGSPGSGKTTFAQALVDLYHKDNKIIKTLESPRDLMVSDDVVQYSFTYGSHDELRDILLLSRPDYTVYDEIRNKSDFELYKDMRLTGIGLIGVIHATRPVDSIQRFLGSIEMGIIPQVIDTVIYIDKGKISEILQLSLVVKVPNGMQSDDLARPVILVNSFLKEKTLYEIYSFGEQIVVMPISDVTLEKTIKESKISEYAQESVKKKLEDLIPCSFLSRIHSGNKLNLYVSTSCKGGIIGKGGSNIIKLEKIMGLTIKVLTFDDLPILDIEVKTQFSYKKGMMSIQLGSGYAKQEIVLLTNENVYFFRANLDGKVIIKNSKIAKSLEKNGFLIINLQQI